MSDKIQGKKNTPTATASSDPEPAADGTLDFEAALAELEALVDQMEGGDLALEASLAAFERGIKLTRQCQSALRAAELRIQQLTRDGTLEDLDLEALDDA